MHLQNRESLITMLETIVQQNHRMVIAIDGRGGAGKSSLARELVENLPAAVHIEYDWFHLPQKKLLPTERFDNGRLIHELLRPFAAGDTPLQFRKYNWGYLSDSVDEVNSKPDSLNDVDILIIEGCELLNPTLLPFIDHSIWLDTDAEESLRRGINRDIEEYGLEPTHVHQLWKEWTARENDLLAIEVRRLKADWIVQ